MLKYISSFTFHFDFEFIRILFLKIKILSDIYNQRHHPVKQHGVTLSTAVYYY